MTANARLQIIIDALNMAEGELKGLKSDLKDVGKETKQTGFDFGKLRASALAVTGAVVAAGMAMKKAFELGEQGAQIRQLSASAEQMGVNLEALRAASNNTISDFDLLNATQTLLIGTQGKLRDSMINNADQLLRIAKAANKLNPALGDTSFLYQSLATGIKRSSPLILDNLGLVVKVGEANEQYAAQLGKTVGQLTAAEKQQALLNATLAAGDALIEQAGGNVESLSDSYAILRAEAANTFDKMKAGVSEAIGPMIDALAEQTLVYQDLRAALEAGIITQDEYNRAMQMGAVGVANLTEKVEAERAALAATSSEYERIDGKLAQYIISTEDATTATQDFSNVIRSITGGSELAAARLQFLTDAINGLTAAQAEAQIDNLDAIDNMDTLDQLAGSGAISMGQLAQIMADGTVSTDEITGALSSLNAEQLAAINLSQRLKNALDALNGTTVSATIKINTIGSGGLNVGDVVSGSGGAPIRKVTTGGHGALQHGGPVTAGRTYLVGERGPELFTSNQGGYVTPNNQLDGENAGAASENLLTEIEGMRRELRRLPSAIASALISASAGVN